jgi:hypothetical protein
MEESRKVYIDIGYHKNELFKELVKVHDESIICRRYSIDLLVVRCQLYGEIIQRN